MKKIINPMLADINELINFLAVAKHLSFRKAAEERNVTPSTISHSMRTLEDRLGVKLLNRTTRSVVLTEAGGLLYGKSRAHAALPLSGIG